MTSYPPNGVDPNSRDLALPAAAQRVFLRQRLRPTMPVALRYASALISVAAALVLARTFFSYGLPQPFGAFALGAIAATFWYGGARPGILAALMSWLVNDYLVEPQAGVESGVLSGLLFLVFALIMTLVMRACGELVERGGTSVDVTERKRCEEALQESEAKAGRLVDANIIGIFIWHIEGRIIEANDAFLRMVDYDREDLVSGRMRW